MPADLAARTLELVDFASESRDEAALAAHVLGLLPGARDAGDTCVLAGVTERGDRPLVLLAGHLDTVPAQGNRPGRRDADAVHGLGASDMKAGVAVMIETALADAAARSIDLGFVFFGREELPAADSALAPLLEREPGLRGADLAIVMEPTANAIQAGCLGNINATWTFAGTAGHSARPWLADNAIHRAARGVAALAGIPVEAHVYEGLEFREVGVGDADRRRDRRQRDPRRRDRARQLPLRPRPLARGRRGPPARLVRAPRRAGGRLPRPVGGRARGQRARRAAAGGRRPGASSPSRPGRRSPSSPPPASTR